jgi:hypothetical protein
VATLEERLSHQTQKARFELLLLGLLAALATVVAAAGLYGAGKTPGASGSSIRAAKRRGAARVGGVGGECAGPADGPSVGRALLRIYLAATS